MDYSTFLWCILVLLSQFLQKGDATECVELATKVEIISSKTENSIKLSTYNRASGAVVDVTCFVEGYEVLGARRLKCLPSGEWSAEKPVCVPQSDITNNKNRIIIVTGSVVGGCLLLMILIVVLAVFVYRKNKKGKKITVYKF